MFNSLVSGCKLQSTSKKSYIDKDARKKAVLLRQSGSTLAQVKEATGLSAPTIIALNKAYRKGGMKAIESRKVGRPPKSDTQFYAKTQDQWASIWNELLRNRTDQLWTFELLALWLNERLKEKAKPSTEGKNRLIDKRSAMRLFREWGWMPPSAPMIVDSFIKKATHQNLPAFSVSQFTAPNLNQDALSNCLLYAQDRRGKLYWNFYEQPLKDQDYLDFCQKMLAASPNGFAFQWQFAGLQYTPILAGWLIKHVKLVLLHNPYDMESVNVSHEINTAHVVSQSQSSSTQSNSAIQIFTQSHLFSHHQQETVMSADSSTLTHLQRLEAESIHILREVVAEADKPVMLYSIGKDSAVMLHLALKAFYPAPPPFPLLHVDTGWKFKDMYAFRDRMKQEHGFELLTHINPDGLAQGINPFTHGSQIHTDIMKTQGLKQALSQHGFDVAFGGARRDEEKSRAKERIFSFRNSQHHWDPKQQRPELWNLYNTKKHKGESIRVFPISNWTELDIWQYIYLEKIPLVHLYFAQERPVVERDGTLIMVDDERMPLAPSEVPMIKKVRFRTLGCYPLTGAVLSNAATLPDVIKEILLTKTSERQGRVIDHDGAASMEKKKQEGYF